MAIMRWDPFGEMHRMQRDMDRIFSRMGEGSRLEEPASSVAWMPKINVKQGAEEISMNVELAGIKPDDIDIEFEDGVLTVRGERKAETEREDEGWLVRESSFGSFERSMVLPEGTDAASIRASVHDGMLEVHIPRALEAARPAAVKIPIGGAEHAPAIAEKPEAPQPHHIPLQAEEEHHHMHH